MKHRLWFRLILLIVAASLVLTSCLPDPLAGRLRGSDPQVVDVTVEVTPLNPPSYAASSMPLAAPAATPPAAAEAIDAQSLAQDSDAGVAVAWAELAYRLVRDEKLAPPVAARLFAYSGVALYESVAPGMPGFQSLAGQLNELTPLPQPDPDLAYHWPAVANAALATLYRTLFAGGSGDTQRAVIDLERQQGEEFAVDVSAEVLQRSAAQGQLVGLAIFQWAQADGYAYLSRCATPVSGEAGHWLPTPPGYTPALLPCWGQMRPFVLRERSDECQPVAQPQYSEDVTSQFYLEAVEVYQTVNTLSGEQMEIARFWADDPGQTGTPPGHSLAILTQVIKGQNLTLDAAAEAYARMGIALADAFISCWQTKFATDVIRPVTYIQQFIDPGWTPPVTTPPFPEFTSGHSVQTAAAAAVLGALFGDDYAFTDHTHDDLGYAPRSFDSFSELANEAAMSRLYGGIHYSSAIEVGLQQGACIGERVNALKFRR